jgi:tetratricopeptide (TPR) repeat protein
MPISSIKKAMLYCSAFLVLWALCLVKIAPSYIAGDSPETIMAFLSLGIQHPPGYALNTLIGKIFLLFPAGSIMFKSAIMAMFFNIAAAFVVFFMALKILSENGKQTAAYCAALLAAAFYLFSNAGFLQGLTAKGSVYTLHCFLMAAIFLSLFHARQSFKFLYLSSFLFGLSLGNHWQSSIVLFPAMALAVYMNGGKTGLKTWLKCCLFFLAGASIFAYLFIRAAAHPLVMWGDVKDLKSLIWLLCRGQYSPAEQAHLFSGSFRLFKYYFSNILPEQYPALFAFVLFPGAGLMLWKVPKYGYTLIAAYACYISGLLIISTWPGQEWIAKQFMIFTSVFTAIFMAYGFYWAVNAAGKLKTKKAILPAASAMIFMLLYAGAPDYSRYFLGYDYMNNTTMLLPKGGLYFAEHEINVFTAMYKQLVDRKNINVIAAALLNHDWYREHLKETCGDGITITKKALDPVNDLKNLMSVNKGRGIFCSKLYGKKSLSFALTPRGIVNEVMADGGRPGYPGYSYFKLYAYRGIFDNKIRYDDFSRMFVLSAYEECLAELADNFEEKGDIDRALYLCRQAFLFFEDDNLAAKTGSLYIQKNDYKKSQEWLNKALGINPKCVNAYYLKAAADYMLLKDMEGTRKNLQKVLELDKNNGEAKTMLEKIDGI